MIFISRKTIPFNTVFRSFIETAITAVDVMWKWLIPRQEIGAKDLIDQNDL